MSWTGDYAIGLLHEERAAALAAEARRDAQARAARRAARRAADPHGRGQRRRWTWRPATREAGGYGPAAPAA